jgi:hypothetical protein
LFPRIKGNTSKRALQENFVNETNVCLSQKGDAWIEAQCATTPVDEDTISCDCDELSIFSVVDDAEGMFMKS